MHFFFFRYTTVAVEPIVAKSEIQKKIKVQVFGQNGLKTTQH